MGSVLHCVCGVSVLRCHQAFGSCPCRVCVKWRRETNGLPYRREPVFADCTRCVEWDAARRGGVRLNLHGPASDLDPDVALLMLLAGD